MLTEIPEVKLIHDTRSDNSGNIHGENFAYLSGGTRKVISRKLKYILTKKLHHNYQDILGYKI